MRTVLMSNMANLHPLTQHVMRSYAHKWQTYCDHRFCDVIYLHFTSTPDYLPVTSSPPWKSLLSEYIHRRESGQFIPGPRSSDRTERCQKSETDMTMTRSPRATERSLRDTTVDIERQRSDKYDTWPICEHLVWNYFTRKGNIAKSRDRMFDCDKGQISAVYRRKGVHLLYTGWRTAASKATRPIF